VYSGGEPLIRKDLPEICKLASHIEVRQSLLTNGLLLVKRSSEIIPFLDEVIVSLDGPDANTHNAIRGLDCFDQIVRGIEGLTRTSRAPSVSVRYVVQRKNFRKVNEMVGFARELGVSKVSFLTADVRSLAFHRDQVGPVASPEEILLDRTECAEFRESITAMLEERRSDFQSHFIAESPRKMMHLVEYFEAQQEIGPLPRNECNAPSVSLVISSTGDVLPCYFLPTFSTVRSNPISRILNSAEIKSIRSAVLAYQPKECHQCVCTLNIRPFSALLDAF
jgi:MoaA/NifB/PqqE/SkfB family radical SAM enzyme